MGTTINSPDSARSSPRDEVDISIVIPAYNEECRLPKTLLSIVGYFGRRKLTYEIIVVDDGSRDHTVQQVQQFQIHSPQVKLLSLPQNRGKGFAVRSGVLSARGKLILFNDADGATPIEEIERLENAIHSGAQVAIGSRALISKDTHVETHWHRIVLGRMFNAVVNFLLLPGIADTQCGFKMFLKPVAHSIFSKQTADRFSFDVEVLFLARKFGYTITEVPVNWVNQPGSKVNLVRDSARMFFDMVKFRIRDLLGWYGEKG